MSMLIFVISMHLNASSIYYILNMYNKMRLTIVYKVNFLAKKRVKMATLIDYFLAIKGIACLSERQSKDLVQVEDLIHMLQTRISIEESCNSIRVFFNSKMK